MDACQVLLGRHYQFDREAVHEGKRNVYSFEMNGKRHSLYPFIGKQVEVSNQLLMLTDKRIVNDWKVENEVKVIAQVNYFEIEMTNKVCTDWLKERKDQHEMSNASIKLMQEAQCEVIKDGQRYMTNEITKDGDVTETRKGEKSH